MSWNIIFPPAPFVAKLSGMSHILATDTHGFSLSLVIVMAGIVRMLSTSGTKWSWWILSIRPWPWFGLVKISGLGNLTKQTHQLNQLNPRLISGMFFFSCWSLVLSCPILVRHFSVNHPRRLPRVIRNDPRINWTAIGRIMMAYFRQAEIGWFNHKILGFNARKFFCGLTWFNRQTSAFELGFNHQNLIFARTIGIRNQEWGIENWMVGRHDQNL